MPANTTPLLSDARRGFRDNLPVAASVMAYGGVLGVLAARQGLSWLELAIMNSAVFAGSAQFVMVEMWTAPLPLTEMTLAVLVINLRYLLIGASLEPLFAGAPLWRKLTGIHLTADENWAVTMAQTRRGQGTVGHLLGGGVCVWAAWNAGTLLGLLGGSSLARPEDLALDFAFTALFLALAVSMWRGGKDRLPWLLAAGASLLTHWLLPGKWHVLAGGLAGALAAMLQPESHAGGTPDSRHGEEDHARP